jgi:choice-of-anchor B domain-containing protein
MKKYLSLLLVISVVYLSHAQNPDFNFTELSHTTFPEDCNDIWGYVDANGLEYAIIGTSTSTTVFSLADPSSPQEVVRVPGSYTVWRDMKSWDNYIYSVCDNCGDGLVIIDMTDPLNPTSKILTSMPDMTTGGSQPLEDFHNIFVDEFGFLYACGGQLNNGGVVIMDVVTDPWNPVIVGYGDFRYSHDIYVRNNIIYSSDVYSGFFSVMDATDKSDVRLLATQTTTGFFTHNAWLSDDGNFLFTTDEVDFGYLDAYDISDLNDIKRVDTYRPPSTDAVGVTPHNCHVWNDYVVTSWYTDGVKIIDAQYPDNLIEVASLDTWEGSSGGTRGNWGAYPFLPSGIVLVSDISSGLYVLEPVYERASYLHGQVTEVGTTKNITQVKVDILGDRPNLSQTSNFGTYKTGLALTGNFDVQFTHPLYRDTIVNVRLKGDSITVLDMAMTPRFSYVNILATVLDFDGNPVDGAPVLLTADQVDYSFVSDANGNIDQQIFDLPYRIKTGKWGYGDTLVTVSDIPDGPIDIHLPGTGERYTDRFLIDQGWIVVNDAETGEWERGIPQGTNFQGGLFNPDSDSPNDIGDECYGTGLRSTTPFDNDVDGEYNTLTTPVMTLAGDETSVKLSFDYWFRGLDTGNGADDTLRINIWLDGTFMGQLAEIAENDIVWRSSEVYDILNFFDFFPVSGELQVSFLIGDEEPGNPLEAAVDNISILVDRNVGTKSELVEAASISIYPNPVHEVLTIDVQEFNGAIKSFRIYDLTGREVIVGGIIADVVQVPFIHAEGIYLIELIDEKGQTYVKKLVK